MDHRGPTVRTQEAEDPEARPTARSRSGGIVVETTPQGLPLSVRLERTELDKDPSVLAADITRLCRQSAMSAGIAMRERLARAGVDRTTLDAMGLPTVDTLARWEHADDAADPTMSWMQKV